MPLADKTPLLVQLAAELHAMASYASGSGLAVPSSAVDVVAGLDGLDEAAALAYLEGEGRRSALVQAHERMRLLVAPATPRTLHLLSVEAAKPRRFSWLPSLGPVPSLRHLTLAALALMTAFIGLSLSRDVNRTAGGILDASGVTLLLNLLFVLAAAGLGAVFAALFQVSRHVKDGTYDPKDDSQYWLNIVLGLIAGLLLAELLPEVLGGREESGFSLVRPILALVGGFSAAVVFRILRRLVDATESVFAGDIGERVQSAVLAAQNRLATQQAEDRLRLSATLMQIEQQLNAGASPDDVAARVRAVLGDLLPFAAADQPPVDRPPAPQPPTPALPAADVPPHPAAVPDEAEPADAETADPPAA